MKIVVYGAGVMAQYVKESILNTGNEFVGFVDPLGNGDYVTLKNTDVEYEGIIDFSHFSLLEEVLESAIRKKCSFINCNNRTFRRTAEKNQ
jgi:dihydrodipicolinate reductase